MKQIEFSPIIIGTMRWGKWGKNASKKEYQELIETALQEGLFTFDHAAIYGGYTTENEFGSAIFDMKIDRKSYQIITKCGIEYPCDQKPFSLKSYNYSKESILQSVDESLYNLKTDFIDVLLLHRPSPLLDYNEVAEAIELLQNNGKVKNIGVSNFSDAQLHVAKRYFPNVCTNQIEFSVNNSSALKNGTVETMKLLNVQPTAYSVMGNYFTENSEQNTRLRDVFQILNKKYNTVDNQLLLAFITKIPFQIIPVIGTSNPKTIAECKKALQINLEREDWFRILEAVEGQRVP